ncbi:hypothetical protein HYT45_01840 [Candidatus Uhrbacteria bacterium]|nr:hypothetical protein [Candidatus Uhrbacteria bacterium]
MSIADYIVNSFSVTVDFSKKREQTLRELEQVGNCRCNGWLSQDPPAWGDTERSMGSETFALDLFHFTAGLSARSIFYYLASDFLRGYSAARYYHLFELALTRPDFKPEEMVVAVGSVWLGPGGEFAVPYLQMQRGDVRSEDLKRTLWLRSLFYPFHESCQFLLVRPQ